MQSSANHKLPTANHKLPTMSATGPLKVPCVRRAQVSTQVPQEAGWLGAFQAKVAPKMLDVLLLLLLGNEGGWLHGGGA